LVVLVRGRTSIKRHAKLSCMRQEADCFLCGYQGSIKVLLVPSSGNNMHNFLVIQVLFGDGGGLDSPRCLPACIFPKSNVSKLSEMLIAS